MARLSSSAREGIARRSAMSLKVKPRARVVGMYTGAAKLGQNSRASQTRGGRKRAMGWPICTHAHASLFR